MGWLDELFSPNGSIVGPGLLASIAKMQMSQPGQSQGFPGGTPIASGVSLPPDNGQMMPVPNFPAGARADAGPYFPPPEGPSFLSRLGTGINDALGNNSNALMAFGGATMTGGLGRGFSAAAAASPLDRAARQERQGNAAIEATYRALIAAGHSPAEALAGSQNPEILKTLVAKPTWGVVGEDMLGNKKYGFINPISQTVTGPANAPQEAQPSGPIPSGQEYLDKYVPKDLHASVKAIASGEMPATGLGTLRKLTPYVENYKPGFDVTKFPAMLQTRKSFAPGGKDYAEVEALNTVGGHMGRLMDSAIALKPSDWNVVNNLRNFMSDNSIIGKTNPDLVKFRNDLVTTKNELAKAYHAGHVTDAAYAAFDKAFNDTMNLPGMKAAIGETAGLLGSKINAKEQGYQLAMQDAPLPERFSAIRNEAAHSFQRINDWAKGVPAAESPSSAPKKAITQAEYNALPKGASYMAPDGSQRTKQ